MAKKDKYERVAERILNWKGHALHNFKADKVDGGCRTCEVIRILKKEFGRDGKG